MLPGRFLFPLILLYALGSFSGCRTEGEIYIAETTLLDDATEGYGPYEVLTRLDGERAVDSVTLFWVTEGLDEPVAVPMNAFGGVELGFSGRIEAPEAQDEAGNTTREPFVLGTRVEYWVEATSDGVVSRAPFEAPRETFFFIIGPARQPVIANGVSPDTGPSNGGTRVFIHGEGFRPTSEVIFEGSLALDVTYVTPHLLDVITPAAPAGLAEIIVRNPSGAVGRLPDAFFFIAPPTPEIIAPDSGPTDGGTRVAIQGTGFQQGASVTFDGFEALNVDILDELTIFATTPPHAEGPVDVVITNPDTQVGTLSGGFTYVPPPEIFEVVPEAGPVEGGTRVEVLGANFQDGLTLIFDNLPATVISVEPDRIVATTPAHPAGFVAVTVINPDNQRVTGQALYAYLGPPELLDIQPDQGTILGNTEVRLIGQNFFEGMVVTFDGLDCFAVVVEAPTLARCVTPPHPEGFVDVTITNIDGQSDTLNEGFEYIPPPPEIISIDPSRGPDLGGTRTTIEVRFGQRGMTVLFDDRPAQVLDVVIEGEIAIVTVITPAHPEGLSDVIVINPDGLDDTEEDGFLFVGPPIIDSIDPDRGPDTGGQRVTITGRNFLDGMVVTFDGLPAEVIESDPEAGFVIVITPPHAVGFVDVRVTNPDNRSDTAEDAYEYVLLPPEIDSVEPDRGAVWGGTEVTITGSSFREGVQVLVNGILVTAQRIDGGTIRLIMPPGEAGLATIEVINPDNQSDSAEYTYVAPRFVPDKGLTAGFTTVTITGLDFDPGTRVNFDGVEAIEVTFIAPDRIQAISPPNAVGSANIGITTGGGLGDTFNGAFSYTIFVDETAERGFQNETDCLELEAGDIDGDGDNDLIVGNGGFAGLADFNVPNAVYTNNGAGVYTRRLLPFEENTMNVAMSDIDGDEDLDLLVVNLDGLNRLYLNDGSGNFQESSTRLPIQRASYDGTFVDVNNDDLPDIFLANTAEQENLFVNTGNGRFTDRSSLLPPNDASEHDHDVTVGDFNGDTLPDFAFGVDNTIENNGQRRFDSLNRLFLSTTLNGAYTLDTTGVFSEEIRGDFLEVVAGDIDGDGLDDIIAVDNIDNSAPITNPLTNIRRNTINIYMNQGAAQFSLEPDRIDGDLAAPAVSHALADLDEDGDLDLIVAASALIGGLDPINPRGQPNFIFVNRGDGFFFDAGASWPDFVDLSWDIEVFDADGDGSKDLHLCNYLSPNRMLIQRSDP